MGKVAVPGTVVAAAGVVVLYLDCCCWPDWGKVAELLCLLVGDWLYLEFLWLAFERYNGCSWNCSVCYWWSGCIPEVVVAGLCGVRWLYLELLWLLMEWL